VFFWGRGDRPSIKQEAKAAAAAWTRLVKELQWTPERAKRKRR
jgi:hypothetical protein